MNEIVEFENGAICRVYYLDESKLEDENTFWYLDAPIKPSFGITDKYFRKLYTVENYINSFTLDEVNRGLTLISLEAKQLKFEIGN